MLLKPHLLLKLRLHLPSNLSSLGSTSVTSQTMPFSIPIWVFILSDLGAENELGLFSKIEGRFEFEFEFWISKLVKGGHFFGQIYD